MADEQKIVVEVPSDRGHYSPVPIPQLSRLEEFKKGWIKAIALPDNLPDMAFELTSCVAIPALFSSCWVNLPIPTFMRLGLVGLLSVAGISLLYVRQAVPEVKDALLLRVGLIAIGVLIGL
ncbi:MAG: hypothetical protein RMZ42_31390 [Nostoc sp. DedQUE05]|uniref:hypothetical protein n=1 Tax=Nostoc sp. DedQUE05 TaxID=3075391 RepID=UPI002AD55FED|nr:hypothetical protein [Nostoc sp. DedQUE05]MDZ8096407.1 hypothetical protein [Nostoc sp. DedQUE05]